MISKKYFLLTVLLVLTASIFTSCNDDDDNDASRYYPDAVVTIKQVNGQTIFQLNDSTRLYPVNLTPSTFVKEVRAFVNYRPAKDNEIKDKDMKNVYVNWVDTIRTKNMAEDKGTENNKLYGNDRLEIVNDWMTVCEDGYLTLRMRTYFSPGVVHYVNLVKGAEPYEVVLHQDARGDTISGRPCDAIMAFRLDKLPDTKGKYVDLTLKYRSFSGEKSIKFKYRTRNQ